MEESTPIGQTWVKECDYDVSLFMSTKGGASQTTYECGHTRSDSYSYGFSTPSNHATICCNASLVGCHDRYAVAGRSCDAHTALRFGDSYFAGGFALPSPLL